jgi:hypothetical protein
MCLWSRSGSLFLNIEIQFLLNSLSLLWPIDSKLGAWVAYIKRQLCNATQMFVIKVKVTVAKNRNSVSTYVCFGLLTSNLVYEWLISRASFIDYNDKFIVIWLSCVKSIGCPSILRWAIQGHHGPLVLEVSISNSRLVVQTVFPFCVCLCK